MSLRLPLRMGAVLIAVVMCWTGCASDFLGRGQRYSDRGRHQVALEYFLAASQQSPAELDISRRARDEMLRRKEVLMSTLERQEAAGDLAAALGTATWLEWVCQQGAALEYAGFDGEDAADAAIRLRRAYAQEVLERMDEADEQAMAPRDLLAVVRHALALNPRDGDIHGRYTRLRDRMTRFVRIVPRCSAAMMDACVEMADSVLRKVSEASRELLVVVPNGAPRHNTDLVVTMDVFTQDAGWERQKVGKAVGEVVRYSDTREPVLDKKGKPVKRQVHATYATFSRTAVAKVQVGLELFALEGSRRSIWLQTEGGQKSDRTRFYDWSGDHRALDGSGFGWVRALGTDRTPPTDPSILARRIREASTEILAAGMIAALDGAQ